MDDRRHQRAMELFDRAVSLDLDQRRELLATACGEDTEMRAEVESLLEHHRSETILADAAQASTVAMPAGFTPQRRGWSLDDHEPSRWRLWTVVATLLATVMLTGVGRWVYQRIERSLRQSLGQQLNTVLDADIAALHFWVALEKAEVNSWAENVDVRDQIQELVDIVRRADHSLEDISGSTAQRELLRLLEPVYDRGDKFGFTVLGRDGVVLANNDQQLLGEKLAPAAGATWHA